MGSVAEDFSDSAQPPDSDSDQRVYFVPYRWWKEAHDSISDGSNGKKGIMYAGSPVSSYPMKYINTLFNSDLAFNLRREEDSVQDGENGEVGVLGKDFALVSGEMWVQALKWHSDAKIPLRKSRSFSAAEDDMSDVYPLQLRLAVVRETNTLAVRITKRDNATELFKRACKIFSADTETLRIWDFSGQTTLFFLGDNSRPLNFPRQSDQEILLELQIYGLSDSTKCKEGKKDEKGLQHCNGSSLLMNGITRNGKFHSTVIFKSCREAGPLGLVGLQNLGNTCFMNSALQCLAHTPRLVDYFHGDYAQEINHGNPLGMDGEIALAFGDLLRKLWEPGATAVTPRTFKTKLARFAPQFNGYNQHDSQELLAFLLDGLHEDLNCVKYKPYVEAKDTEDRADAEVADEYWNYHLARNNSIIVDVCQGQYRSTLVCPMCKKVSVTFDPFMYLSLPLPSTTTRTMTLTVVSSSSISESTKPLPYTITVSKNGKFEDLIQALSTACSLGSDETLLVAEVYNSRIIRFLEDSADSLKLIRDEDQLVAYRLTKPCDEGPLVVFMHRRAEQCFPGTLASYNKTSGIPLVARLGSSVIGSDICSMYHGLLSPFRKAIEDALVEDGCKGRTSVEDPNREDESCPLNSDVDSDMKTFGTQLEKELQFYLTDEKGLLRDTLITMDDPISLPETSARLNVLVCWPDEQMKKYDDCLFTLSPEMVKSGFLGKRPQETASLYKCLEAFLTEEPLGPEDMWYCPRCKEHRQASKKLDLWRLPEILVIHLKRFSYDRFLKNKLETFVDFPIDDLDLSNYVASGNSRSSEKYMLYAISNHYGSMGGGHYTAFVHHGGDLWHEFDDNRVYPISLDKIKTSAAYVLFYKRVSEDQLLSPTN